MLSFIMKALVAMSASLGMAVIAAAVPPSAYPPQFDEARVEVHKRIGDLELKR